MVRKLLASAVFALAVVTPAAAEEAPAAAPPAAQPAQVANPDEVICKREEQLGTRFAKRVCMTRAQWEQRALNARRSLEGTQRGGGNPPNMGGG